jgi:hypothetical protein
MNLHAIRYGHPASGKASRGFDYQTQSVTPFSITPDDIVVNVYQPKSRFLTTVFEPTSKLSDSLTYDITAWNLLYAYDLHAYAITERINIGKPYQEKLPDNSAVAPKPYAYIFRYQALEDVRLLSALMKNKVKVRSTDKNFTVNRQVFSAGALIVTRRNNETIADFDNLVITLANKFNRQVYTANTGFVEAGKDLGSTDLNLLKMPRIAVLFGEQTSSLSSGEVWHFFEQQISFPITQIRTDYFKPTDLKKYDIFIVPQGNYKLFDEPMLEHVSAWVNEGGKLILLGDAVKLFADKKGFGLQKYASDEEKIEAENENKQRLEKEGFTRYEEAERKEVSESILGAIYKVNLDNSHPLGFGMRNTYFTLKTNELRFAFLTTGWNVGYFDENVKPVQGFAGHNANRTLENSLLFGVEEKGRGQVIYLVDNPLFRSFWENGNMLFANAVFMVGQ